MTSVSENTIGADFANASTKAMFAPGTILRGSDGRRHIYAQANGAIAATTRCALTDADFQMATGSGNWDSIPAVADDEYAWFKERTLEIAESAA
ncbi:MAG: hypothetical protein AAGB16_01010 [Pseudomonadota bacterium]